MAAEAVPQSAIDEIQREAATKRRDRWLAYRKAAGARDWDYSAEALLRRIEDREALQNGLRAINNAERNALTALFSDTP